MFGEQNGEAIAEHGGASAGKRLEKSGKAVAQQWHSNGGASAGKRLGNNWGNDWHNTCSSCRHEFQTASSVVSVEIGFVGLKILRQSQKSKPTPLGGQTKRFAQQKIPAGSLLMGPVREA